MALFGRQRDIRLFNSINRELLRRVINQEVLYHKISLESGGVNLYGESREKMFTSDPFRLVCLVTRNDQAFNQEAFGPDLAREMSFAFLREDLVDCDLVPEVGDFIRWHQDFYEVDVVRENQLFLGKDANYSVADELLGQFGASISIICDAHISRESRIKLTDTEVLPSVSPSPIPSPEVVSVFLPSPSPEEPPLIELQGLHRRQVESVGGQLSIPYTLSGATADDIEVKNVPEWVEVGAKTDTSITFAISENTTKAIRTATIILTISRAGTFGALLSIYVVQK